MTAPNDNNNQIVNNPQSVPNTQAPVPAPQSAGVPATTEADLATATMSEESAEILRLHKVVIDSQMPQELKTRAIGMLNRLEKLAKFGYFTKEFEPVEKYIGWITKVPWGSLTPDNLDLNNVKAQLDKTHYGLNEVKERIMEYTAMLNLLQQREKEAPGSTRGKAPVVCFVGVQGIGKTSIAKSIAAALGRKFVRIPLGGMADIKEIRGLAKSDINGEPGQIAKAFIRTETMNPMILLDEVDKVSQESSVHADVMAALLEILDPEQNYAFSDHYLDYPLDLSKCIFICTANNLGGITAALLDRMEVIRMSSYNDDEKEHIARDYLLPRVMADSGLKPEQIQFSPDVWPLVIRPLGFDAGIRQLERNITTLVRKVAKKIVMGEGASFAITPENFREYFPMDMGVYS